VHRLLTLFEVLYPRSNLFVRMLGSHFVSARTSPFRFINGLAPKDYKQLARYVTGVTKPPNILIVSRRSEPLRQWKQLLWTILSRDSYVIYELKKQDLGKELWKPYTSLLILDHIEELDHSQAASVENYVFEGGRAWFHYSICPKREGSRFLYSCGPLGESVPVSCCFCTIEGSVHLNALLKTLEDELQSQFSEVICKTSVDKIPVVVAEDHGRGKFITSQIDFIATNESVQTTIHSSLQFQRFMSLLGIVMHKLALQLSKEDENSGIQPTIGVIFGDKTMSSEFVSFARQEQEIKQKEYLSFIQWSDFMENFGLSNDAFVLTVPDHELSPGKKGINFDAASYWKHLHTNKLGRLLVYTEVITSTQEVLNRILCLLPQPHGFMIVAGRQTEGKGRSGNVWLSPIGCMMFSLCICIPCSTVLGQKIPFVQQIAAVAFVKAVRDEPGYEAVRMCYVEWVMQENANSGFNVFLTDAMRKEAP